MSVKHDPRDELRAKLWGSLLLFTQTFYPLLTGRDFIISRPVGRESHFLTICRALTKCARLETNKLVINISPGSGKSSLLSMFVAWTMSRYPDSRYLYISYSKVLAAKHTEIIRRIIALPYYRELFNVHLMADSKAKDFFQTTAGGAVGAFGSASSVTGQDAGLPGLDRFSGALLLDDLIKPDDAHSDTVREGVITNYRETIQQRVRGINVPSICIGQRLHEADLPAYLLSGADGDTWEPLIIPSLDAAENALYPEAFPKEFLLNKRENDIYVFASQHQQNPQPAGGALYRRHYFALLDEEPKEYLATFLTCDTAETSNPRNDATVFSFWGLYEIETMGKKTGVHALHWINCAEIRVEPKDLKDEFMSFYQECLLHPTPPLSVYIEKKSTGVTLISVFDDLRGLKVVGIERSKKLGCRSNSKAQRFIDIQPYIAAKCISLTKNAPHTENCVTHMTKITANDTHAFDDICDTCSDAVHTALIYKLIYRDRTVSDKSRHMTKNMADSFQRQLMSKKKAYQDATSRR